MFPRHHRSHLGGCNLRCLRSPLANKHSEHPLAVSLLPWLDRPERQGIQRQGGALREGPGDQVTEFRGVTEGQVSELLEE